MTQNHLSLPLRRPRSLWETPFIISSHRGTGSHIESCCSICSRSQRRLVSQMPAPRSAVVLLSRASGCLSVPLSTEQRAARWIRASAMSHKGPMGRAVYCLRNVKNWWEFCSWWRAESELSDLRVYQSINSEKVQSTIQFVKISAIQETEQDEETIFPLKYMILPLWILHTFHTRFCILRLIVIFLGFSQFSFSYSVFGPDFIFHIHVYDQLLNGFSFNFIQYPCYSICKVYVCISISLHTWKMCHYEYNLPRWTSDWFIACCTAVINSETTHSEPCTWPSDLFIPLINSYAHVPLCFRPFSYIIKILFVPCWVVSTPLRCISHIYRPLS